MSVRVDLSVIAEDFDHSSRLIYDECPSIGPKVVGSPRNINVEAQAPATKECWSGRH